MAKLTFIKRLVKEDFKQADRDLIGKIAFILNPAFEQITRAFSNGLTFEDNMAAIVKTIEVTVDSSGNPTTKTTFQSGLKGTCQNIIVTRAQNLTNSSVYPTGAPFISFTDNSGTIQINNVTGLPANNSFSLRLIATL